MGKLKTLLKEARFSEDAIFNILKQLVEMSDLNNPNKSQQKEAEDILTKIGLYDEEGQLSKTSNLPSVKKIADNWDF